MSMAARLKTIEAAIEALRLRIDDIEAALLDEVEDDSGPPDVDLDGNAAGREREPAPL
jgi:hypothetical protein